MATRSYHELQKRCTELKNEGKYVGPCKGILLEELRKNVEAAEGKNEQSTTEGVKVPATKTSTKAAATIPAIKASTKAAAKVPTVKVLAAKVPKASTTKPIRTKAVALVAKAAPTKAASPKTVYDLTLPKSANGLTTWEISIIRDEPAVWLLFKPHLSVLSSSGLIANGKNAWEAIYEELNGTVIDYYGSSRFGSLDWQIFTVVAKAVLGSKYPGEMGGDNDVGSIIGEIDLEEVAGRIRDSLLDSRYERSSIGEKRVLALLICLVYPPFRKIAVASGNVEWLNYVTVTDEERIDLVKYLPRGKQQRGVTGRPNEDLFMRLVYGINPILLATLYTKELANIWPILLEMGIVPAKPNVDLFLSHPREYYTLCPQFVSQHSYNELFDGDSTEAMDMYLAVTGKVVGRLDVLRAIQAEKYKTAMGLIESDALKVGDQTLQLLTEIPMNWGSECNKYANMFSNLLRAGEDPYVKNKDGVSGFMMIGNERGLRIEPNDTERWNCRELFGDLPRLPTAKEIEETLLYIAHQPKNTDYNIPFLFSRLLVLRPNSETVEFFRSKILETVKDRNIRSILHRSFDRLDTIQSEQPLSEVAETLYDVWEVLYELPNTKDVRTFETETARHSLSPWDDEKRKETLLREVADLYPIVGDKLIKLSLASNIENQIVFSGPGVDAPPFEVGRGNNSSSEKWEHDIYMMYWGVLVGRDYDYLSTKRAEAFQASFPLILELFMLESVDLATLVTDVLENGDNVSSESEEENEEDQE